MKLICRILLVQIYLLKVNLQINLRQQAKKDTTSETTPINSTSHKSDKPVFYNPDEEYNKVITRVDENAEAYKSVNWNNKILNLKYKQSFNPQYALYEIDEYIYENTFNRFYFNKDTGELYGCMITELYEKKTRILTYGERKKVADEFIKIVVL